MLDRAEMGGLCFQSTAAIDQFPACHRAAAIIGVHHRAAESAVTEWLGDERLDKGPLNVKRGLMLADMVVRVVVKVL